MSRFISIVGAGLIALSAVQASAAESFSAPSAAAQAARPADDLAAKVLARINAEPDLKGHSITVTASNGVVTMEGQAPSPVARAKAAEIAKSTEGVRKINNKMKLAKA
jgi:osmotically-inducible protein OsmY